MQLQTNTLRRNVCSTSKPTIYRMRKVIISFVYIVTIELFGFLMWRSYNQSVNSLLNSKTDELKIAYSKVVETYSVPANVFFYSSINNPTILSLYSGAHSADSLGKEKIRGELYSLLSNSYSKLTEYNYRQLQFFLPD